MRRSRRQRRDGGRRHAELDSTNPVGRLRGEAGLTLVEYALCGALVASVSLGACKVLYDGAADTFSRGLNHIGTGAEADGPTTTAPATTTTTTCRRRC